MRVSYVVLEMVKFYFMKEYYVLCEIVKFYERVVCFS